MKEIEMPTSKEEMLKKLESMDFERKRKRINTLDEYKDVINVMIKKNASQRQISDFLIKEGVNTSKNKVSYFILKNFQIRKKRKK